VIIIACAVFLAVDPGRYRRDLVQLLSPGRRVVAEAFLDRTGSILRLWLVSRAVVMIAIGILSCIGVLVLHIPAALALGLTGALLTFIPYLGPLLAAAPAVLVAFTISPLQSLLMGLMFWGVQFIEGTFITPVVQDKQVALSPVVTILGTFAFGATLGPSGFVLASSLILVFMVAIQVFYSDNWPGPR
jgi:predicted PurR-regulated permease PerM